MTASVDLTFVVPALNEADSLPQLFGEIQSTCRAVQRSYEVIVIDDGSTDGTIDAVRQAQLDDPSIRLVSFTRNFGKAAAYTAAFQRARGEFVVTMDADLQDDPAELPKLLAEIDDNDIVVGWKIQRMNNEPTKTLPSRVFNTMNRLVFGVSLRDQNSGYRIMRRETARALELSGDNYRFIPQLAHLAGFRVGEVGVVHRKRQHGVSKYGVTRFWTGLLDLLTVGFLARFRDRPLHFFGTVGIVPVAIGVGLLFYVLTAKLLGDTFREHVAALIIGVTSLLIGVQSVLIGLVAELLAAPKGDRFVVSPEHTDA